MSDFQYLCGIQEVQEDKATIVQIGKRSIGVFKLNDGSIHALLNLCPHKGAALCEGPVCGTTKETNDYEFEYIQRNEIVRCAWHGWEFDIKTGEFLVDRKIKARKFLTEIKNQKVYIQLPS